MGVILIKIDVFSRSFFTSVIYISLFKWLTVIKLTNNSNMHQVELAEDDFEN